MSIIYIMCRNILISTAAMFRSTQMHHLDNETGVAFTVPEFHLSVRKRTSDELCLYRGNDYTIISNTVDRRDKTFEISYLFRFMCITG